MIAFLLSYRDLYMNCFSPTEICIIAYADYGYRIKYLDLDYIQNSEFITMNSSSKTLLKCSCMSDKLAG